VRLPRREWCGDEAEEVEEDDEVEDDDEELSAPESL